MSCAINNVNKWGHRQLDDDAGDDKLNKDEVDSKTYFIQSCGMCFLKLTLDQMYLSRRDYVSWQE